MIAAYSEKAKKDLEKIPLSEKEKILRKIEYLKTSPHAGKKLKGEFKSLLSLKAWPYRVIYHLNTPDVITLVHVRHRQSAY